MIIPEIDHVVPQGGRPTLLVLVDVRDNRLKRRHDRREEVHASEWPRSPTAKTSPVRTNRAVSTHEPGCIGRRRTAARSLDQFYTCDPIAIDCLEQLSLLFDLASWVLVEPSAGGGAFSRPMPRNSIAFDVEPKCSGIIEIDFLSIELRCDYRLMTVGNPPFGRNASLAVRFFNHAAQHSDVIAMIFPRSFLKASIENRLNSAFHLVHSNEIPPDAFEIDGERRTVAAVFQIWERRADPRAMRPEERTHPDFEFTIPRLAKFVIRRAGAYAGRITHDCNVHEDSHYFIKGDVEHIMAQLDLVGAARLATSTPSLAKAEIVALYRMFVEGTTKGGRVRS